MLRLLLAALLPVLLLAGCATTQHYSYRFVPGRTATLSGGYAVAPESAPEKVKAAIDAANKIAVLPYRYGGGHGRGIDSGYDCSGATSYVLCQAGLLNSPTTSKAFRSYGRSGEGRWISLYARNGHVFLVVAGLRFDTGWGNDAEGPRWTTRDRPIKSAVIRHPAGY
jgi:hypothetical protein